MLRVEDNDRPPVGNRKTYSRSVSWTDRSPSNSISRQQFNSKARACLPPLQPLSISRPQAQEWPRAGTDDLGVWPNPPTPGVRIGPVKLPGNSDSENPPREFEFKKDKLAFFDKECSRIVDHIYLGSDAVAKNREILRQNGVTHVLNCVGFVCPEYFKSDLVYKTLWLQDSASEDITSILYDVFDYFEDVREQGGRVLVHCCQGVSRSTTLVIAYLMWREGQSFEDAFQRVKAARGVTNPNMGFACQLLQCQKRVHAAPISPNSMLRMYRMAPHSPYDPLHLVPKLLNQPGVDVLDSRGAFIVHVPSAMYVWIGKNCAAVMSDNARAAAFQVIRYERAQGSVLIIGEGKETSEFWTALGNGRVLGHGCNEADTHEERSSVNPGVDQRKVESYDLDFEIFNKALSGGVVPPSAILGTGSETCLPARENGWGRLRRKFANGTMKELIASSKLRFYTTRSSCEPDMVVDKYRKVESSVSPTNTLMPFSPRCDSPYSFSSLATNSPKRMKDLPKDEDNSVPLFGPTHSSPDSFSCFLFDKPKFNSPSPSLSPSTSDYSNPFTFSPSSSNWSDLSYLSAQPSPSGLESIDPYLGKNNASEEISCFVCKETSNSPREAFSASHAFRSTCLPYRRTLPSIAERRGSKPPPQMKLPSVDDASQVHANKERSQSFTLLDLEDDVMQDVESNRIEEEGLSEMKTEDLMTDADILTDLEEFQSVRHEDEHAISHIPSSEVVNNVTEATSLILYLWPTMDKVEMNCIDLESRSVYFIFVPNMSLGLNEPGVLYVWVGQDVTCDKGQGMIYNNGMCEDKQTNWETIGYNFLLDKGFATNSIVQIVRKGEEPEQLSKHLPRFSFQMAKD